MEKMYIAGEPCLEQDLPNLKRCRDYLILQKTFTKKELATYERQLAEYLNKKDITDDYLYQVPRIVCWYEGMIPTEDFINEYQGCMKLGNSEMETGGHLDEDTGSKATGISNNRISL